jgi:putative ABC transport system permease protein
MAIPLSYNIRNLRERKTTTIMTAAGIALSVAVLVASLAVVNGLKSVFENTAHPLQLLVLRKGATSELGSIISTDEFTVLRSETGLAVDRSGQLLASPELVNVANLPSVDNPKGMNVTVRGLSPAGVEMRAVRLIEGRWFQPGQREVVVGKAVALRYPSARIGSRIRFGKGDWQIVGVMDGGESALNSEIWGDLNQISADYNRQDSASSVLLRAADPVALEALKHSLEDDRRLNVRAIAERDYYQSQTAAGAPLEFLGIFVAVIRRCPLRETRASPGQGLLARRRSGAGRVGCPTARSVSPKCDFPLWRRTRLKTGRRARWGD